MTSQIETRESESESAASWQDRAIVWGSVTLSFAVYALWRISTPAVNEPHYLTKAKHFWDPTWCSRDIFLTSYNAHYVFYWVMGIWTRFCSLETTAWIGRLLGWGALAAGWCSWTGTLSPQRWFPLVAAWVYLGISATGSWSGEWVIGGIESKVFAYAGAWAALGAANDGRWRLAMIYSGLATSFHPVVGIWHTLCLLATRGVNVGLFFRTLGASFAVWGLWMLCAAPGLIPALGMLSVGTSLEKYQADYIQVFHRLAHHLDPTRFSLAGYVWLGMWLAVCVAVCLSVPGTRKNVAGKYLLATLGIACAGIVIRYLSVVAGILSTAEQGPEWLWAWRTWEPHSARWLKFYPFRLLDGFLPAVAAIFLTTSVCESQWSRKIGRALCWGLPTLMLAMSFCLPVPKDPLRRMSLDERHDWEKVCTWVRDNTPPDALSLTTNEGYAFRWYGQRAEYAVHKDCPQDAPTLVAWNERLLWLTQWSKRHRAKGFGYESFRELRERTEIDFIITSRMGPFLMKPIFQNGTYRVYAVP